MAQGSVRKFRLDADDDETFDMTVSKNIRKRQIKNARKNKDVRFAYETQTRVKDIV